MILESTVVLSELAWREMDKDIGRAHLYATLISAWEASIFRRVRQTAVGVIVRRQCGGSC